MDNLTEKIYRFGRRKRFLITAGGAANVFVLLIIIWASTALADSVFVFSVATRWAVLIINGSLSLILLWLYFINPLKEKLLYSRDSDLYKDTKELGRRFPEIADRLTNVYQLNRQNDAKTSPDLAREAVAEVSKHFEQIPTGKVPGIREYLFPVQFSSLILVGSIILFLFQSGPLTVSLQRVLDPGGNYQVVPDFSFSVAPGDSTLVSSMTLRIRAAYSGPAAGRLDLYFRETGSEGFQSVPMVMKSGLFSADIKNIRRPIDYFVRALPTQRAEWSDKIHSKLYSIETVTAPVITNLQTEIVPPAYTRLPVSYPEYNSGDILAYPGSVIKFSGVASKSLNSATLIYADSSNVVARVRENRFNAKITMHENKQYHFEVIDQQQIKNQNPISWSLTAIEDQYPLVTILEPGADIEIAIDAALMLKYEASDDFGFSSVTLNYQMISALEAVRDSSWNRVRLPLHQKHSNRIEQAYPWSFSDLPIGYGDAIRYFISVYDNDRVSGPKQSRSEIYNIRFPSLDQMFTEFEEKSDEQIEDSEEIVAESEKLKKELEKINREMKRENQISWERKKELESALEKQKEIQEKLQRIQKEMEDAVQKLSDNQMLSPEIMEKYNQLQELFKEIASPELLDAMRKLQEALDKMNTRDTRQALNNFKRNQQRFQENLERTLELFKRVQLEQDVDRLVQTAKKLAEEQQKINEQLKAQPNKSESGKMAAREEQQRNMMDQLQRQIDRVKNDPLMAPYSKSREQLQNSNEMITQKQLQQRMKSLQQQLQQMSNQGNLQSGTQQQSEQLSQDLQELGEQLKQAQQNMQQQAKQQMMAKMQHATEGLLSVSRAEENVMNRTEELSNLSDKFREMAELQNHNAENLNKVISELIDLSQQTFFISPEISKALGRAQGNMRKGLEQLANRNQRNASANQRQAMSALNQAVMEMQGAMQSMSQSSSAMGFEQFLQRMQQMAGQQGQLNQESLGLMQGKNNQGNMSVEQQRQMQRMAARQQALKKGMQQLHEEMGDRSDVLGRLDKMAEEMAEVVKDLQQLKIDRRTIERQQNILSRMLDAQKSVREREYSKKRKAEVGKEYARRSPRADQETADKRKQQLEKDLIRALHEGYTPDYEKLIEAYFKELGRKQAVEN